jgi:hypothetical protein
MADLKVTDIANDQLDPHSFDDGSPSIAVNPANPRELAVVSTSGEKGIPIKGQPSDARYLPVWRSVNSGGSWRKVYQIDEAVETGSEIGPGQVTFDSAGRLLVVVTYYLYGLSDNLVYRQDVVGDAPLAWIGGGTYGHEQGQVTADRYGGTHCSDSIYWSWLLETGNESERDRAIVSVFDSGGTWTEVEVGQSSYDNDTVRMALGPDGKAYLLYKTRESVSGNFTRANFWVARSDDCARTWAAAVSIHGPTPVETWQTWRLINVPDGLYSQANGSDAAIAVSPSAGHIYVAYVGRASSGFAQLNLARSTDEGRTWVSTPLPRRDEHCAFPAIAVADNDTLGVLYLTWKGTRAWHRFARSADHGTNWDDQIVPAYPVTIDPTMARKHGLTALGTTFFGVFNGRSIGRSRSQLDPILLTAPATPVPAGTWHTRDLTAVTSAVASAGDPDGYVFVADGSQHVVYRGTDNHIHKLWNDGGWHTRDLTAETHAVNSAGDPDGYMFDAQGTQHVMYRGTDNHIHELWSDGNWHTNDLTAATSAVNSAGDPDGYMFDAQGTQHVMYRGTDNHIHELWWDGDWHTNDLTAETHAVNSAGDPDGYMFGADGSQHVVYRGTDNHIHKLWWDGSWHTRDLTAETHAVNSAGDPDGYMFDAQGTQHVVYRGTDNHIHKLWNDGGWHTRDLTAETHAVNWAGDPDGYMFDAQGTQHVMYRGTDNHIHELWSDGNWRTCDLTTATTAVSAAGDPDGYMFDAQRTQHVVYRGTDNHIHKLWWE